MMTQKQIATAQRILASLLQHGKFEELSTLYKLLTSLRLVQVDRTLVSADLLKFVDALEISSCVPEELITLSEEATPGYWFWQGGAICTDHNAHVGSSSHSVYQQVLWPLNVPVGDDSVPVEEMGACGTDTEAQAAANQQLLVEAVNYVRQLVRMEKRTKGESK